jgi:hypothetical protein
MNYTYLRFGDRLPTVGVLQRLLNRAGANLVADGKFGPKTRAAVLDFQGTHRHLRRDGEVGIQTWARLTEGLSLPVLDCVDVYDTAERIERIQQAKMLDAKFQALKKSRPDISAGRLVLEKMKHEELVDFADKIEIDAVQNMKAAPKLRASIALGLEAMSKQQLIAGITKKLAEDRKEAEEWADTFAYEVDDIRQAGGDPFLIGGMSDGVEQAVTLISAAAREAFLLRFHAHGKEGSFGVGAGRAGARWHGNRMTPEGMWSWLPNTLKRLKGKFGPYGSIELMSCNMAHGPEGREMVQLLSWHIGVPVSAGVNYQYAGLAKTFRFEGPTHTAIPDGRPLEDWCRALPNFPKQNASFPRNW